MPSDNIRNRAPISHTLTAVDQTAPATASRVSADLRGGRLVSAELQRVSSAGPLVSVRVRYYRSATISQANLLADFTLTAATTPALPADLAGAVWNFDDERSFDGNNLFVTIVTGGAGETITGQLLTIVDPDQKAEPVRTGAALT